MKIFYTFFFVLLLSFSGKALSKRHPVLKQTGSCLAVNLSCNGQMGAASLWAANYWKPASWRKNIQLGCGLRYTLSASGNKTIYNTAAIDLNRESNFIFSKKVPLNIDTLSIENHQTHTWNLMLCIVFPVKSWEVECRFDVLGFSSGSRKQATLQYGEEGEAIRKGSVIPAPRNLLLLGDNNRGTLNATLGVKHKLKHSWFGEFGLQYLRNEYQFDRPVQYKNSIGQSIFTDRYRAVTLGAMIGLVYSLKK